MRGIVGLLVLGMLLPLAAWGAEQSAGQSASQSTKSTAQSGITSCLRQCSVGYGECRTQRAVDQCFQERRLCADRCDAAHTHRETTMFLQLDQDELESRFQSKNQLRNSCLARCDQQMNRCEFADPSADCAGKTAQCKASCDYPDL